MRSEIVRAGRRLAARGLTPGTSGNISVRTETGFLMTPTDVALADLQRSRISRLDAAGEHIGGDAPTKERPLHLALYRARPDAMAIVHVHSTAAVALACLVPADPTDVLEPLTPYAAMRVGRLRRVPYRQPGTTALAEVVAEEAKHSLALLLANHGPLVAAPTLAAALAAIEEIEEAARVQFLVAGRGAQHLTGDDLQTLRP